MNARLPRRPDRPGASRRCSRASRSARSSTTPSRPARTRPCGCKTNGVNVDHFFPQVIAETKTRRPEPRRARRRAPGLRPGRAGHQRRRLGHLVAARAGRADLQARHPAAQQDPLHVVRRRGGRPRRLAVLRRAPLAGRGRQDRRDDRHRHDRLAELRAARLRRRRRRARAPPGPAGSGTVENVFKRYFAQRGMATLPHAFDGRSDYVGFINRGIPAGGIFAGAEVAEDAGAGRAVRRRRRRAVRPVLPRGVRQHRHGHGPAARRHDERLRDDRPGLARAAAGGLAQRQRAEVAARDVGRRDARGLVLRARQATRCRRARRPTAARKKARPPVQVPGAPDGPGSPIRPAGAGGGVRRPRARG